MSDQYLMNRIANSGNRYQGDYKRVLCVCSAGLLRSPTAAFILSNPPFNFNTRACGLTKEFALIPLDRVLLEWADEVVCMDSEQKRALEKMLEELPVHKPVICLSVPDRYGYRDPVMMKMIIDRYTMLTTPDEEEKKEEEHGNQA